MDIERDLLGALLRDGEVKPMVEANIQSKDFTEEGGVRPAIDFVLNFWLDYQTVPSYETVAMDFADALPSTVPVEPLDFYVDEMVTELKFRVVHEGLRMAAGFISSSESGIIGRSELQEAIGSMMATVQSYHDRGGTLNAVDISARAGSWWTDYLAFEKNRQSIPPGRIPLGLPAIDRAMQGMRKQNLVTLFGLPKSGKSLVLLNAAIEAHKWGYKPLFVSFEMSVEEQEERYHALRSAVSLTRMQRGRLRPAEKRRIEQSMKYVPNLGGFIIAEDPHSLTTVSALAAQIDTHKPDVVYVDGVYMMDDESGADPNTPQALTSITRALKRMAQAHNIPAVVTTQALEWKTSKTKGVGTGSIGYSSSFLQDSDMVIGIDTPDPEENPQRKRYKVLATRVGTPVTHTYDWDFDFTGVLHDVIDFPEDDTYDGTGV